MKVIGIGVMIALVAMGLFAQADQSRSDLILQQVKQASSLSTLNIEGAFVESDSKYNTRKDKLKKGVIPAYDFHTELWIQRPDRIKIKTLTSYLDGSFQLTSRKAVGQTARAATGIKNPGDNGFMSITVTEPGDPNQNEQILRQKIEYEAFCNSFPIFFYSNENLKFAYMGFAKSGDQNADVLATTIASRYKLKLYFDQKTHQLLLIVAKFVDAKTNEEIEQKHFFSNYRKENGINLAHTIIVHENGDVVEQREVKKIELNPKVESNFFEIKK